MALTTARLTPFTKDPSAVLDYGFDWTERDWLEAGETITASTWAITEPSGEDPILLVEDSETSDTTTTTIWLSAGTVGKTYSVTNHITTSAGRQDDRTFKVKVANR